MLRLPLRLLVGLQRERKVLHAVLGTIMVLGIEAGCTILLRRLLHELGNGDRRITNMIIGGKLVPIKNPKLDVEVALVTPDVEEELLIPVGVQRMPDDTRPEDFLAEGDDDKWVHVPARARHCTASAQLRIRRASYVLFLSFGRSDAFFTSSMTIPRMSLLPPRL